MGDKNTMTRAELELRIERLDLNSFHTNHLLELYRANKFERIEQYLAPLENPPKLKRHLLTLLELLPLFQRQRTS